MITDHEWSIIAKKAFPAAPPVKAPPFLWTRILSAIETEETRRSGLWWMQWRWMSRVTVAVGLLVSLGAFYLLQNAAVPPLDVALEGRTNQHQAIRLATADMSTAEESGVLIVGLDS
jgi:hypothetical protein